MYTDMENWAEIRRRVLVDGLSKRAACREYDIHWDTLTKILDHPEPPGYRRTAPRPRPKLDPFLAVIHQILEDDRKAPRKQRHTARRIFERLRDEHGYTGGLTVVKEAVAAWRARSAEVFVPLAHPPGEAQVDFGEAEVTLDGRPDQGGPVRHDPAVLRRHLRAAPSRASAPRRSSRATSGPSPSSAASPAGSATTTSRSPSPRSPAAASRKLTDAFLRLKSHHLFEAHFCRVRRPNEKGHVETLVGYARRSFLVPGPRRPRRPGAAQRRARARAAATT